MKYVTLGDIVYALTPDKIRSIRGAIEDTNKNIENHNRRRPEHRDQQLLNRWNEHVKMLEGLLEGVDE
jgi:hypothetical protein